MVQKLLGKLPWYIFTLLGIVVLCGIIPTFQQIRQEAADVAAVREAPVPGMQPLEDYVKSRTDAAFHQAEFEANVDDYVFTLDKHHRRAPDTHLLVVPFFADDAAQNAKHAAGVLSFDSREALDAWDEAHSEDGAQSDAGNWRQQIHGYEDRHPELQDMISDTLGDDGYTMAQPFLYVRPYVTDRASTLATLAKPDFTPVYVLLGVGLLLLVISLFKRGAARKAKPEARAA